MSQRIDALDSGGSRLTTLTGRTLDDDLDEELQQIVRAAASGAKAPIALVSLVLERIQLFRAHYGLPPDLEIARATDRTASFCQFVVRDGQAFVVENAGDDERVPQDLVDRYGIQSYMGMPVRLDGEVVGSLCVVDVESRGFSEQNRSELEQLAERASRRLAQLALEPSHRHRLVRRATAPAFVEVNNRLFELRNDVAAARISAAELAPIARLQRAIESGQDVEKALASLQDATGAICDLLEALNDMDAALSATSDVVGALRETVGGVHRAVPLADIFNAASRLCHHSGKLAGGVEWPEVPPGLTVDCPRGVATSTLVAIVTEIATKLQDEEKRGGIVVGFQQANGYPVVEVAAPDLTEPVAEELVGQLERLLEPEEATSIDRSGAAVSLYFCPAA